MGKRKLKYGKIRKALQPTCIKYHNLCYTYIENIFRYIGLIIAIVFS